MTSADAPAGPVPEAIRLSVPAEPDMVQVVRVAVRIVAGRAGCSDDARSRLQAAVGTAYFALLDRIERSATVVATLTSEEDRVVVELGAAAATDADLDVASLDVASLGGLADGQELSASGDAVRMWVDREG